MNYVLIILTQRLSQEDYMLRTKPFLFMLHVSTIKLSSALSFNVSPISRNTKYISRTAFRITSGCCRKALNSSIMLWRNALIFWGGVEYNLCLRYLQNHTIAAECCPDSEFCTGIVPFKIKCMADVLLVDIDVHYESWLLHSSQMLLHLRLLIFPKNFGVDSVGWTIQRSAIDVASRLPITRVAHACDTGAIVGQALLPC